MNLSYTEREAQIRRNISNLQVGSDSRFLLRLLDEARASLVAYQEEAARLRESLKSAGVALANRGEIVNIDEFPEAISRLGRDNHGHHAPCLMCGEPCNSLAGNPSLWALRLGNNGWHHVGCVNKALRELERLRALPVPMR